MNSISSKFVVSGKVQGVGFRFSARKQALMLGIHGYAKNLPSGDVEVLAIGSENSLKQLCNWLKVGPKSAMVDSVVLLEEIMINEIQPKEGNNKFTIL